MTLTSELRCDVMLQPVVDVPQLLTKGCSKLILASAHSRSSFVDGLWREETPPSTYGSTPVLHPPKRNFHTFSFPRISYSYSYSDVMYGPQIRDRNKPDKLSQLTGDFLEGLRLHLEHRHVLTNLPRVNSVRS